jgi:uncharacterized phiE125 gp8 family phage protein
VTPTIVVAPVIEPVSLVEAKLWCGVDSDIAEHDTLIEGLIAASREYCEHRKGYAFYEQTLEVACHDWPCAWGILTLPRATPLRSVESVKYIDEDGDEQTLASSNYRIDTAGIPGGLAFISDFSAPSLDYYAPRPIVIRYIAGQPNASPANPFPESVKVAMQLMIAHLYRNREAVIVGTTSAVASAAMELGVDAMLSVNQQIYSF